MLPPLRLTYRRLAASPGFTLFAIASLAVGIGVTTAAYSVITALAWRSPAIADPDRLVLVLANSPSGRVTWRSSHSRADFEDVRAAQRSFDEIGAAEVIAAPVETLDTARIAQVEAVSANYFRALGGALIHGRGLHPADDDVSASSVVVLGYRFWRVHFHADPSVVGRSTRIFGHPFEIVGVAAERFDGLHGAAVRPTDLWIPLSGVARFPDRAAAWARDRERRRLTVFGRLASGRTMQQAEAEVAAIATGLDVTHPVHSYGFRDQPPMRTPRAWGVTTFSDDLARSSAIATRAGVLAFSLVALVLAIACTNLAGLMLARGASRRQEFAIRRALGAPRSRLVLEILTESVAITVAGGFLAALVARTLLRRLTIDLPVGPQIIMPLEPVVDMTVAVVAVGCTALSLIVFGLIPALHVTRPDLRGALTADSGASTPRWRGRRILISWQVAACATFLLIATVSFRSVLEQRFHDPGVDVDRLAIGTVDFRLQRWDEARARTAVDGVLAAAGDLEGATGLAVATGLPFGLAQTTPDATLAALGTPMPDVQSAIWAPYIAASPQLFGVTGIRIVAGRAFDGRDTAATEPVVVVSQQTARQVFGTTAVVGREIQVKVDLRVLVRAGQSAPESDIDVRRIIGIASDTDSDFLYLRRSGVVYVPLSQQWEPRVVIVARASDPAAVASRLPAFLRRVDPDVAVAGAPGTGPMLLTPQYVLIRMLGSAAAMLGLVSLALALTGLYGVLSHVVASRTREMGIRLALGAEAGRLRRMILLEGVSPIGRGLALGLVFAILARLILRVTLDLPIALIDPLPFAVVPALLIAAGLIACHLPARRASRVNPTVALRDL